jgi:glyoxylase-like metal-dependent hydrolase (beta-lactamase superfamily II)
LSDSKPNEKRESNSRKRSEKAGLSYPFDPIPAPGKTCELAPGVVWIRMPLPFELNHINLYGIADGDSWAVVDTGAQTPEALEAWTDVMSGPFDGKPVSRVFATHMHPDHIGMAGWITRKHQCRLWMSRQEYLTCRTLVADTGREAPTDGIDFYRAAGWEESSIEVYKTRFGGFGKYIHTLPDSIKRMRDGETIRIGQHDWQVVIGRGHSPEHACLYNEELKLLVSGDQVLPRISSNVSVFPTEPDADPLGEWIESIDKLRAAIPDDVLVLPSHNEPFRGLHARLDALKKGHETGLSRLRKRLAEPRRVVDVFGSLFAREIKGTGLLGMATGEALAHLNYLVVRDEATVSVDEQGVAWYQAT